MRIRINKETVSYRDSSGEWLDGDRRVIRDYGPTEFEIDADDVELYGSEISATVAIINQTYVSEPSISPISSSVPEHCWLSGSADNHDETFDETTVYVLDCTDEERAEIFRRVCER